MYLDWVNNFTTVSAFADHYGISEDKASRVIKLGGLIHQQIVSEREFHAYMKQQIRNDYENSLGLSF
jgi:hypothetical protein